MHLLSFIIFYLLCFSQSINAQEQTTIDSLKRLLINTKIPYEKAELYYQLSKQHYLQLDFDKAEEYTRLALKHCSKNNHKRIGGCYNILAGIYGQTFRNQTALNYVDSALYSYELIQDSVGIVLALSNKGGIHMHLEQFKEGAKSLYRCLEISEKIGHTFTVMSSLYNLTSAYSKQQNYTKVIVVCNKILRLASTTNDAKMKARGYSAMAKAYFNSSKVDSALIYYLKSIPEFEAINNYEEVAIHYAEIGYMYALQKKYPLALEYIERAQTLDTFIYSQQSKLIMQHNIANIYYTMGNYDKSSLLAKVILDSAIAIQNLHFQKEGLKLLKNSAVKLKQFEIAYNYQAEHQAVLDIYFENLKHNELLNLEIKYETEKIQQENKLLAKEKDLEKLRADRNRQLLYLSILAIALILGISFLLVRQYKTNAALLTNQLKHRLLRNQMSPHFIFNSLVAIQNFVYKKAPIQAGEYLASFAQLIRAILENSREEYIPLEKEIQWLDNYFKLQLLRFDNSFDYTIDIDENIDLENMLIPPMLTQPFIENAIEHGLSQLDYRGEVIVKIKMAKDLLQISVSDNGIGLETSYREKSDKKHTSLALKITKERLHFLNKKRGNNMFFDIKNLDTSGTLVSFSLPLTYKY